MWRFPVITRIKLTKPFRYVNCCVLRQVCVQCMVRNDDVCNVPTWGNNRCGRLTMAPTLYIFFLFYSYYPTHVQDMIYFFFFFLLDKKFVCYFRKRNNKKKKRKTIKKNFPGIIGCKTYIIFPRRAVNNKYNVT